jgi:tetratricopeptide (TPR) repeat protein
MIKIMLQTQKVSVFTVCLTILAYSFISCSYCSANDNSKLLKSIITQAGAHAKEGEYLSALALYNQAIKIAPDNLSLYLKRAFVWGHSGNYPNAINDFTFVINRDMINSKNNKWAIKFSSAPRFRADCYMAIGLVNKAIDDYLYFLKSHPKDGKVWSYLAEAYSISGNNALALLAVKKGLKTNSHWSKRLMELQNQIMVGKVIDPHQPLSN